MVICLKRGADLHIAQRMPLPLTVSCFSEIQTGLTFLAPAHPGSPGQRAIKRVCVCECFACFIVCCFYILIMNSLYCHILHVFVKHLSLTVCV